MKGTHAVLLKDGEENFNAGNIEKARRCFEIVAKAEPCNIEALNNLGVIAFKEQRYDDAITIFQEALATDPQHLRSIFNTGKCFQAKKEFSRAAEWYQKGLQFDNTNYDICNHLGDCFVKIKQYHKAADAYEVSLRLNSAQPKVHSAFNILKEVLNSLGKAEKTTPVDSQNHRPKVLYVDAISAPHAACNVNGAIKAFKKASTLKIFDYRGIAAKYGALRFKPDMIHLGKSESIAGAAIKAIKERIRNLRDLFLR